VPQLQIDEPDAGPELPHGLHPNARARLRHAQGHQAGAGSVRLRCRLRFAGRTPNMTDRRLTRHLAIVVLLKLIALTVLWWFFFRESGVA
jgi:hypothetical protein